MSGAVRRSVERSVEIPDDLDDPATRKASGVVELPHRVRWSAPRRRYDLSDRVQRARVYEQVLREGTPDDIRYFIQVDDLIDLWPELFLPDHIRCAWRTWLERRRAVELA